MDRSVTVYTWLFDPIDAGPFGLHCLISCQREDEIIQARISGQAPKEVAERAYRRIGLNGGGGGGAIEVFAVWQVYTRCSRSGQQLGSDGVDKEIQSRAPNLYELLHGL